MTSRAPSRAEAHRRRRTFVAVVAVVGAALVGLLVHEPPTPSPSSAAPPVRALHDDQRRAAPGAADGTAGGALPDGVSVFDERLPAVANLDADLLGAVHQAATDAGGDGVDFFVTSGWRSPAYQARLLREAVAEYGSEAEAARWVASPETSAHVSGAAIDIGPSDAIAWLSAHGAAYGLCQVYGNEPWHYELRPDAVHEGCPAMYADPTQDPRLQP